MSNIRRSMMAASRGGGSAIDWESIARGMLDTTTQFSIDGNITANVGNYMFYNRAGLIKITIPNDATTIGISCFSGCTSLDDVVVPDSVTSFGSGAFQACTGLKNITIGSGLTIIGQSAFQSCTALESLTIPNSVTNVGVNFMRQCTSLKEIIMQPTTPPTMGANGFLQCANLAAIYVPDASVNSYKTESSWSAKASIIKGISERPTT